MKIALIHMRHAKVGGTELFLNQLSKYLCEQGEEVTVICRSHEEPSHPNIKFVQLKPWSLGKAHRAYRFAKAVEKHVAESDYDIVYALGKTWTHDLIRVGGGTRKHIVKLRKDQRPTPRDRVSMYIEQKALTSENNLFVVSNSHKSSTEIMEDYGVDANKIATIHNAVDLNRFSRERCAEQVAQLKQKLQLNDQHPIFLFLGSGYNRKGLEPTLRAFSLLKQQASLVIVGNEQHPQPYKDLAKSLGIEDKCHFLGKQGNPEVFFSMASCYVFPTKYEPFGFTAIEALSSGCPVITTVDCGAKEVMNDSVSTILEKDYTVEKLAEAMTYWAEEAKSDEFRNACRQSVAPLDVNNIMEMNYQLIKKAWQKKQQK
ncbi:glycosyltransferase family 4 protein [Vibrio mytili]|uniref:Group 1 glycosyl transferase n=1 Tax=Vibrio mytili TaxID=50718 RepID=A0A0C3HPX5_9VIBR|nr:glycosyltransferase family 4 protein [Vibrio mytili]KIN10166.1 group 1 glycosyl transferase [Vibrio mytili]